MLARNELLMEITYQLAWAEPDWDAIVRRFLKTIPGQRGYYDDVNLRSYLSEAHIRTALEKICAGFGERVLFDPIRPGNESEDFFFEDTCARELVILKKEPIEKAKFNLIVENGKKFNINIFNKEYNKQEFELEQKVIEEKDIRNCLLNMSTSTMN